MSDKIDNPVENEEVLESDQRRRFIKTAAVVGAGAVAGMVAMSPKEVQAQDRKALLQETKMTAKVQQARLKGAAAETLAKNAITMEAMKISQTLNPNAIFSLSFGLKF